ncbi:mannose-binding lectin superfamily protein, partial [Striga asiatica]
IPTSPQLFARIEEFIGLRNENDGSSGADMSIRSWGGQSGKPWNWRAECGISQIIIRHGGVIDSIMCKGHAEQATTKRFGGKGGDKTEFIDIDYPNEFLTGISGTVGHYGNSENVVTSIEIITNRFKYGPFGKQVGTQFSFHAENGVVIGFHGRADSYMNAIGVYLRMVSVKKEWEFDKVAMKKESKIIKLPIPLPRSPGPWGNVEGGKPWDDGVFSKVKEVNLHLCLLKNIICGVQFLYERRNGCDVLSRLHGSLYGGRIEKLKLGDDDFVVGVEVFYGPIEGVDAIKSLKFNTKKKEWGPFGMEVGRYFNSNMGSNGVANEYWSSGEEISVRSWGGQLGKPWNWRAKFGIRQIIISHGDIIDSIVFKDHAEATTKRFGGKGGDITDTIDIDYPYEFVTGVSGSVGHYYDNGKVVTSLKIITNRCKYGHFGKEVGTYFSFHAENGVIIGFHGRADSYINAIGVYVRKIKLPIMESDNVDGGKQSDREYEIV